MITVCKYTVLSRSYTVHFVSLVFAQFTSVSTITYLGKYSVIVYIVLKALLFVLIRLCTIWCSTLGESSFNIIGVIHEKYKKNNIVSKYTRYKQHIFYVVLLIHLYVGY